MPLGSSISRNTLYNLAGHGALVVTGIIALPLLTRELGIERFGILSMVRVLVIYVSILDFGFTAAVTQRVAEARGRAETHRIADIFRTANLFLIGMGVLGGILIASSIPAITCCIFNSPPALIAETSTSLVITACVFPFITLMSSVTGTLQGLQRFDRINAVLIPMNIGQFVVPLVAVILIPSLPAAVAGIFLTRALACFALLYMCGSLEPLRKGGGHFSREEFRGLIYFGKWMTVANILDPVMSYSDRLFLSIFHPIASVAYYTVPSDIAVKTQVLPRSLLTAVFPVLSAEDEPRRRILARKSMLALIPLVVLPIIAGVVLAPEIMRAWMGVEFARESSGALQILLVGALFGAFAMVPQYVLLSRFRADVIGKIHLVMFPLYLTAAGFSIHAWGITGAALVWATRSIVECTMYFVLIRTTGKNPRINLGQFV